MGLPRPEESTEKNSKFKKAKWFKLTEGNHVVRVLSPLEDFDMAYTHWIRSSSVECPGVDCPVCKNNQEILAQVGDDWKEAKKVAGFNSRQLRYAVNVLDRTQVKVSPNSQREFENKQDSAGQWPMVCGDTGEPLTGIEARPSNTIKVLSGGKLLFEDIEGISYATSLETGEDGMPIPLGIENFDLTLLVKGSGRERRITAIPQTTRIDKIELKEELHDAKRAWLTFTPEEIHSYLRGVSLRDIFAGRRLQEDKPPVIQDTQATAVESLASDLSDDVAKKVEEFLSDDIKSEDITDIVGSMLDG